MSNILSSEDDPCRILDLEGISYQEVMSLTFPLLKRMSLNYAFSVYFPRSPLWNILQFVYAHVLCFILQYDSYLTVPRKGSGSRLAETADIFCKGNTDWPGGKRQLFGVRDWRRKVKRELLRAWREASQE